MKKLFFALVSVMFSGTAHATTVTVDWLGGALGPTQVAVAGQYVPVGYAWHYRENGFSVDVIDEISDIAPVLGDMNASYTGVPADSTIQYDFSRTDGGAFGLSSMDIFGAYTQVAAFYSNVAIEQPVFWDAVSLTGVKSTGETVSVDFSPWNVLSQPHQFFTNFFPGHSADGDIIFDMTDFGSGFQDLVSLSISMNTGGNSVNWLGTNGIQSAWICNPLNLARSTAPEMNVICAGGIVPGFSFDITSDAGARNSLGALTISSLTFDVMAPVPLPASLPLLGGALLWLVLGRRRKKIS